MAVVLQICTGKCEQTSSCAECALRESPSLCAANCTFGVQLVDSVEGLFRTFNTCIYLL